MAMSRATHGAVPRGNWAPSRRPHRDDHRTAKPCLTTRDGQRTWRTPPVRQFAERSPTTNAARWAACVDAELNSSIRSRWPSLAVSLPLPRSTSAEVEDSRVFTPKRRSLATRMPVFHRKSLRGADPVRTRTEKCPLRSYLPSDEHKQVGPRPIPRSAGVDSGHRRIETVCSIGRGADLSAAKSGGVVTEFRQRLLPMHRAP